MNTSFKSRFLELLLIAALLIFTPLLSTSLRPSYLYLLLNLLIIVLIADSGLISFFSNAAHDEKRVSAATSLSTLIALPVNSPKKENISFTSDVKTANDEVKCSLEKTVGVVKVHVLKKCPSTPSLFFIGGEEPIAEENTHVEEDHELFQKAETFIGNFYKQLKMQKEDSLGLSPSILSS